MEVQITVRAAATALMAVSLGVCGVSRLCAAAPATGGPPDPQRLTLAQCIETALKNHRSRPASQLALEVAEAQHQQALSGYWPQLSLRAGYAQQDQDPVFTFPSQSLSLTLPGMGTLPTTIPTQRVTVASRISAAGQVELRYPLFTGGLRGAVARQAQSAVAAAREEMRRTDLQVVYDVRRMYYAALLGREVRRATEDVHAQLQVTLDLTESLYRNGSGRVKKTDYLRCKAMKEAVRSALASVEGGEGMALAGLANVMGIAWNTPVAVADEEPATLPDPGDAGRWVNAAYRFSPDWAKVRAGLDAAEAKVREARSGYFPKVALFGTLDALVNDAESGLADPQNKRSWTVGAGMELPIFDGLLTPGRVREARARLAKLRQEQVLLEQGIAAQVQTAFVQMSAGRRQAEAARAAMQAATENRALHVRAYRDELVETRDVIEAELAEAFLSAQYHKAVYDCSQAQAQLEFVVGSELRRVLEVR